MCVYVYIHIYIYIYLSVCLSVYLSMCVYPLDLPEPFKGDLSVSLGSAIQRAPYFEMKLPTSQATAYITLIVP